MVVRGHEIITFHDAAISADANGVSENISSFQSEVNILVDVTAITPTDVGGGGDTTIDADAAVNAKTLSVASETNFAADDWAYIGTGTSRELVKIKSVTTGQLTLYYGTVIAHTSGDAIKECEELYIKPFVETSPDNVVFAHRARIINEVMEGDLIRLTAARAEESGIFACGQYQAQLSGNLGKYQRVRMDHTGTGSITVKCTGDFER